MDSHPTLADELPGLYRSILEIVAPLERTADRARAFELRMQATEIYSRSWDEGAARGLTAVLRRLRRIEAQRKVAANPAPRRRIGDWHPFRRVALSR